MLRSRYHVSILSADQTELEAIDADLVIALHARRSGKAVTALKRRQPAVPVVLVLTGTDLYRDIRNNALARKAMSAADALVVLQPAALQELDRRMRDKTHVIYQSAPSLKPVPLDTRLRKRSFEVCMIGHLRQEKDPATFMKAATRLQVEGIRMTHIGGATLDPALARLAIATQQTCAAYRWLGNMPHTATRQLLKRSHLMVISSKMEGGANVIIEAVTSDVPVLASDIPGNRGMLGDDYAGYFAQGDPDGLARLIERCACDRRFYERLLRQCRRRVPLFSPDREQTSLLCLMDNIVQYRSRRPG